MRKRGVNKDLKEVVGAIIIDDTDDLDDLPSYSEPVRNPVDRFSHLPESTRKWLESLREEDIQEIKEAMKFQRNARTVGSFTKWLIVTFVGMFIGVVAFGEKVAVAWKWFVGAPR